MTTTRIKPDYLFSNINQESVLKYAVEKCIIQIDELKHNLETLYGNHAACVAGIRNTERSSHTRQQLRDYQLLLISIEKDIEDQRTELTIRQQKLEQYQDRLSAKRSNNQLNEMIAAIKSVEQRLLQPGSGAQQQTELLLAANFQQSNT